MKYKYLAIVIIAALLSLAVIWLPFILRAGTVWGVDFGHQTTETIVQNFDGINFLVVAKTLYDPHRIEVDFASILSGRNNFYFAAHYPLFPLLIRAFNTFAKGPDSLLLAIIASNILLSAGLYWFFAIFTKKPKLALFLSLLALFYPARMLAVRAVGSNEPLFMFFVLTSLAAAYKNKPWVASGLGALAVLTRSPGILLFAAYGLNIVIKEWRRPVQAFKQLMPFLLIPAALVGLWGFYALRFGNFWAYFQVGGNINLYFPPFLIFGSHFPWVSGSWLEDIIYLYIVYLVGIGLLMSKWKKDDEATPMWIFGAIYLSTIFFVVHRDIARYALPIGPLMILGLSPYLSNKYVKIGALILLVPICLYSWNFILNNIQPVMDWAKFL